MRSATVLFVLILLTPAARAASAALPSPTPSPVPTAETRTDVTGDADPTSGARTFTIQSSYTGATYGPGNYTVTQIITRIAAFRIGKSLLRITLPRLQTINGVDSAVSDMQLFYLFQGRTRTGALFAGLFASFPTATSPTFGSGKWLLGPSAAYIFTYKPRARIAGILVQTAFSVAGQAHRPNQSLVTFLPFAIDAIGGGWFVKLPEATWVFDLQRGASLIPLGLGFGRIAKIGSQRALISVSDETSVLHANVVNAPKNTVRFTITILLSAPGRGAPNR